MCTMCNSLKRFKFVKIRLETHNICLKSCSSNSFASQIHHIFVQIRILKDKKKTNDLWIFTNSTLISWIYVQILQISMVKS